MGGSTKNVRGVPQAPPTPQQQNTWRWGTEIVTQLNKINHTLNNYIISKVPSDQTIQSQLKQTVTPQNITFVEKTLIALETYIQQMDQTCIYPTWTQFR